jgi:hypothetical protein
MRMRGERHIDVMGDSRNAYKISVRKPEGRRPLGIPRGISGG